MTATVTQIKHRIIATAEKSFSLSTSTGLFTVFVVVGTVDAVVSAEVVASTGVVVSKLSITSSFATVVVA